MTTPVEKRNHAKYCEFHGEVGHTTDELGKNSLNAQKKGKTFGKDKPLAILMVQPWERVARQKITQSFSPNPEISFPPLGEDEGIEGPMIIEAEIGGHCIHRMYVDVRQIQLMVKIGDEDHSTSSWMNFEVIRSPSPYNGIIGRQRVRKLQAVPSTVHGMLKIPVDGGVITLKSNSSSWRMCVDFKDLNKAFPKDDYPLPEIDWKVESLCGFPFKCFLDAYKGYHQIQIEKDDEEKTAFITNQGIFCYTKIPFGLRNAGATYQQLVDKAFHKTLKEINMKLNPKKCTFGIEEGMFLGYKVNTRGLKVCPDKVDAVLSLPSLKCLKDVQKLNGKLASLNRFLAKSVEKSLPFFKTLTKCTKKSDFHYTTQAKEAFKQMKQLIAELPMLAAPMEKEELIVYLAAAKETVSAVLMTEREAKQMPIYFVSRALRGPEVNYTPMEKLVLALVHANKRLKRYFQAHPIIVITDQLIQQVPRSENKKADALSKITSTCFAYLSKQVLVEELKEKSISATEVLVVVEEEGDTWMTPIFKYLTDRTFPVIEEKARAVRRKSWRFSIINGILYKKILPRTMDATGYYWSTMHEDARRLIKACKDCQVHKPIPRNPQQKLSLITSPWSFYMWGIDIAGSFLKGPGKVKFLIVAIDYFTKWIEAKPVTTITGNQIKKFMWDNIVYRFGLLREIILDNGKQFQDNPFKDWCEKLCIRQHFASVKHPQTNGLVERANRSLGEGIKSRLDERSKNWMEELPHVLWAHRTMIKPSNRDTPFSLTYGTEVVILAEIGMPILRTAEVDLVQNNEAVEINMDLLEERREHAAIREAKSKAKMERYYNSKLQSTSFKPGDLVYRNNKASYVEDTGKLGPK
ncbi:reverse transcriptase domain-containing protein [Tanacetum coccineum]